MANEWLEKELEDYIWANPNVLGSTKWHWDWPILNLKPLGRQIKCSTGRIDLLFFDKSDLFVVELKAVKASSKDLGQVTRYSENITNVLSVYHAWNHVSDFTTYLAFKAEYVRIHKVLIAPEFDSNLAGANSNDTHLLLASKSRNGFLFSEFIAAPGDDTELSISLEAFVKNIGHISMEIAAIAEQNRLESIATDRTRFVRDSLLCMN